ncbi:MAG: T9SS type A sorting domain-containing protein [Saprospiraceae bacterium]|nr:T9SS type A sorting domain-containing protein [Saprospiraceae bacterium]
MKKLYIVFSFILCIALQAHSQNLLTEDFLYAPIDSLENSGNWFRSGANSQFNISVQSPGLEYPNYIGSNKGNHCVITNAAEGDILFHNLSKAVTTGSVYLSLLHKIDSLPTTITQGYAISLNPNDGSTNLNTQLYIKRLSDSTFNFGIRKTDRISYGTTVYNIHQTYLAVLKYTFVPGLDNDEASLYVFEQGVPILEPSIPVASTISGIDFNGQGSVCLTNNYAQYGMKGCNVKIDGIRVGTSWETSVLAPISSTKSTSLLSNLIQLECSPNPFYQSTTFAFQIPQNGLVKINILNASGLVVRELLNETMESGNHKIELNANDLPTGLYHCAIQHNGLVISKRIIHL